MNRFSVVEAYYLYFLLWHAGGITRRCERQGRNISTQIHSMRFRPRLMLSDVSDLDDDGKEVYLGLIDKYEMDEAFTCGCGVYVHPSRNNPKAFHIPGCRYE